MGSSTFHLSAPSEEAAAAMMQRLREDGHAATATRAGESPAAWRISVVIEPPVTDEEERDTILDRYFSPLARAHGGSVLGGSIEAEDMRSVWTVGYMASPGDWSVACASVSE